MANTIAGVNLAQIAQESLPALQALFAPLGALTTDFSTDISAEGESVTTRYPTNVVAKDMTPGYETAADDVEMTKATVNLDKHDGFSYGFNDRERSYSSIKLNELFIEPALEAIGTAVFNNIWALVSAANFPQDVTVTEANFDRDIVVDLRTAMTAAKMPTASRALLINPDYYGALIKTLNSAEVPGIGTDKAEGIVPRTSGLNIYETNQIPSAGTGGINTTGFALHKSALLIAARRVDHEGAKDAGVDVETVLIPGLNLPIQFRRWYSPNGKLYFNMNVLYGTAKGTSFGIRVEAA